MPQASSSQYVQAENALALVLRSEALRAVDLPDSPKLSRCAGYSLREIQTVDDRGARATVCVPVERPLNVHVDGKAVGTLMTLGAAPEWLVVGYLTNQLLITDVTVLESVTVDWQSATAAVVTKGGVGLGATAQTISSPPVSSAHISRTALLSISEEMRDCDAIFKAAGSVHCCASFGDGKLWISVEDVSRRNAMDIITGWMQLHGISGADKVLFSTGRLSAEIVIKAAHNGIPILISRKGVTATGYDLAIELGMTLFGRAHDRRFVCYTGTDRFDANS
jgi:FdhD protein